MTPPTEMARAILSAEDMREIVVRARREMRAEAAMAACSCQSGQRGNAHTFGCAAHYVVMLPDEPKGWAK